MSAEYDRIEAKVRNEIADQIQRYADLRNKTAGQSWFNPVRGAAAQGRVAGLEQAAHIARTGSPAMSSKGGDRRG